MQKEITTILLVSNNALGTKSFNIETRHIKRIKLYITVASSIIFVLLGTIIFSFAVINNYSKEKAGLLSKISSMENDVNLLDSLQIKNKIDNIENRIQDINKFLKERGISKEKSSIGGEPDEKRKTDVSIYDYYDKHTLFIYQSLKKIPLGYPYYGELRSEYGYRSNPFGGRGTEFHKGMDFKGNIGDEIKCTADGYVLDADWDKGYGKCIKIKHEFGLVTLYGHLSEFNVTPGQQVKAGDVIDAEIPGVGSLHHSVH